MDTRTHKIRKIVRLFPCLLAALLMQGCFTGVEGTPKIELSRKDLKETALTPEATYLSDIKGTPYSEWEEGKTFRVMDYRVFHSFDQRSLPADRSLKDFERKDIVFRGTSIAKDLSGQEVVVLLFDAEGIRLRYNLTPTQQRDSLLSTGLPMMTDMSSLEELRQKLRGKVLWTLTGLWYSPEGRNLKGQKFVPVKIIEVLPGNNQFPFLIIFTDGSGNEAGMYMNLDDRPSLSRRFHSLFSLTDPKLRYPEITEEVWNLIKRGEIQTGMTKRECRLSIGTPQDVNQGHTQSVMMDIWQYSNGTILFFEDGVLKEFRR